MPTSLLRPMTTAEIIVEGFRLYRNHLASLVLIALVPHLLMLGLGSVLGEVDLPPVEMLLILFGASVVLNAVVLAAMTYAVAGAALGKAPSVYESYRRGLGDRIIKIILAFLIVVALISMGFMALILPGLIVGGLFLPTIPLIVMERRSVISALSRSLQMMKPELLKGVAIFSFVTVISGLLPFLILDSMGDGPLTPLLGAIVGAITLPLAYSANVVLYFSIRAAEGYTEAQLEADLAASTTP